VGEGFRIPPQLRISNRFNALFRNADCAVSHMRGTPKKMGASEDAPFE
jgi:hypothetical protein